MILASLDYLLSFEAALCHLRTLGTRFYRRQEPRAQRALGFNGAYGSRGGSPSSFSTARRQGVGASASKTSDNLRPSRPSRSLLRGSPLMVRKGGLEPPRVSPQDPKSCASASSATFAGSLPFSGGIRVARLRSSQGMTEGAGKVGCLARTTGTRGVARPPRLERGTCGFEGRRSIRLSYGRIQEGSPGPIFLSQSPWRKQFHRPGRFLEPSDPPRSPTSATSPSSGTRTGRTGGAGAAWSRCWTAVAGSRRRTGPPCPGSWPAPSACGHSIRPSPP